MSDEFEYFAVRNSAGMFDSSPLHKYRIHGPDAERFLAGVLARNIRACPPGHAQYTIWCDDRGFVVEDGVILRHGPNKFLLTAAEPNLAYFEDLIGREDVTIEEVSHDVLGRDQPGPVVDPVVVGPVEDESSRASGETDRPSRAEPRPSRGRSRVTDTRTSRTFQRGLGRVLTRTVDPAADHEGISRMRAHG